MTSTVKPQPAEQFLKTVLRSGVLTRDQLCAALRDVPLDRRQAPEALANHLVESGELSRFQADKLLRGMSVGLVLGPFHVLAPIGKGGMGTVYLARDSRSQLLVALKVLAPRRAREEKRLLARFRREMDMCQRVAHPHLAWTCDVGVCQGVYYIALEYIAGRSLYRVVQDDGRLAVSRAARLFGEVTSALEHAHQQGLIHRDMKPSNIMITPHDHAKLLDLGLALVQGEAEGEREVIGGKGYVVGTADYIAPEQVTDAAAVDPRSDIYSLGCTIYYAITGQPPFPGGSALEKINHHRNDEPVPIPQLNPTVPPGFVGLVRRMMSKHPDQRPASAAEVREQLLSWATDRVALPLDRQGDKEFQEAVAAIEAAEVPTELLAEVIPVGIPEPPRRKRPAEPSTSRAIKLPRALPESIWSRYPLLWPLLGVALVAGLGSAGLIAYLVIHH